MTSPNASGPELDILKLLWRFERLSAREIHNHLSVTRDWAYSTTRTTLERMVAKGMLARQNVHGLNVYVPAAAKVPTLASLIRNFTRRVLDLQPTAAIPMFAQSELLDEQERAELERMLREEEGDDPA
ncbi:MAG: BlaI/MecI/CopY family transcriptional regulator [Gammaproteobacteria bacterium]